MNIIITGATGYVGEGVLFACLEHPDVKRVLMVNRRPYKKQHPKLLECIVPDFMKIEDYGNQLKGYDACFFCAGISSVGISEKEYSHITYNTTLQFAQTLVHLNPGMVFTYVSGAMTDSSEKGKIMWARVKGRTENALMRLPFKAAYNFRPGLMKATKGQVSVKTLYKIMGFLYPVMRILTPKMVCTVEDVGIAMINCAMKGYSKQIVEIEDIKYLAANAL